MNTRSTKRTNLTPIMNFLPPGALRTAIFKWVDHQADKPALSEALCRLVELGLEVSFDGIRSRDRQKRRAREMAGQTIDDMSDATTAVDDRRLASRIYLTVRRSSVGFELMVQSVASRSDDNKNNAANVSCRGELAFLRDRLLSLKSRINS